MGRQLEPKLKAKTLAKLKNNGIAQAAIAAKDARTFFIECAKAWVGTKEATGRNDGEDIELFQETIGGHSREYWCMSFVQSMLALAEEVCGVKSPVYASELCSAVWAKTPVKQRVKTHPLAGAIIIFGDIKNGKVQSTGHTEILLSSDGNTIQAVGGNTSGTLVRIVKGTQAVNRNGNGVYYTLRSTKPTKNRKILGYLIPFEKVKA